MSKTTDDSIYQMPLAQLAELGWETAFGPNIAFDGLTPERDPAANYGDVVLAQRLHGALTRINPAVSYTHLTLPTKVNV